MSFVMRSSVMFEKSLVPRIRYSAGVSWRVCQKGSHGECLAGCAPPNTWK